MNCLSQKCQKPSNFTSKIAWIYGFQSLFWVKKRVADIRYFIGINL